MAGRENIVYKVALVGEGGVGKTSLIKQFVYKKFDDRYIKTLGTNIVKKDIILTEGDREIDVHLQIWDVLGQRSFEAIIQSAFRGVNGVILVCDLTNKASLPGMYTWIDYAYTYSNKVSFVFAANKSDIPNPQISTEEFQTFTRRFKSPGYVTSAKMGTNVEQLFTAIGRQMYMGVVAPTKKEVKVQSQPVCVEPKVKAEDQIIQTFCEAVGGQAVAMPFVRKLYDKIGADFEHPTKQELNQMIGEMVNYVKFVKGEQTSRDVERKFRHILHENGG